MKEERILKVGAGETAETGANTALRRTLREKAAQPR